MRSVSTALAFANVKRHAGGGVRILVNVELLALGADFLWLSLLVVSPIRQRWDV